MPKAKLMAVTRRGGNSLEYDLLRTSDNATLVSGLTVPFTVETTTAAWQALVLADAPAKRELLIAALETKKAALLSESNAITAQITDLTGAMTNG